MDTAGSGRMQAGRHHRSMHQARCSEALDELPTNMRAAMRALWSRRAEHAGFDGCDILRMKVPCAGVDAAAMDCLDMLLDLGVVRVNQLPGWPAPPKPSIMTAAPSRTLATATSTTATILPITTQLGDNRTITFPLG